MSLVEQALRKIQSQGQPQGAPQAKSGEPEPRPSQAAAPPATNARPPTASNTAGMAAISQRPTLTIDLPKLRSIGLLPPPEQERTVTRELRAIKHGLLRKMSTQALGPNSIPRTVMVTSSLPGDGKTFSTLNLALSLALEKDLAVLLVDADVLKPQITSEFGLANAPGLIDVLSDPKADIVDCVRQTQVRNLYFLPAGSLSDVATELLFSERMASVTRQLVNLQPNLLVLFDSSPTLVTVEARALAVLMSQILVVVRANATPQPVVRQTLELLAEGGSKVSLILNDARELGAPGYSYGGSYGDARRAST